MSSTIKTEIVVNCDNKACTTEIRWNQEEAQRDMKTVPEAAFRILILELSNSAKAVFCSKACLLAWLRDFVPLKSPKVLEEERLAAEEFAKSAPSIPDATGDSTPITPAKVIDIATRKPVVKPAVPKFTTVKDDPEVITH
jgi:hypothetical protein